MTSRKATGERRGRPTKEQSQRRHEQLLDLALESFASEGYAGTAIASLAESMGMTKRTIYALYPSKDDLFRAAMQRGMESVSRSIESYAALETEDLAETLQTVAEKRVELYESAEGRRLQKIITTESSRFPELVALNYRASPGPAIDFLTQLFRTHFKAQGISTKRANQLAEMFLGISVGATVTAINAGKLKSDTRSIRRHVALAVTVFLNGAETAISE